MTFDNILKDLLKKDLRFVDEDSGELIKNEIINYAYKIDKELISLLLDNKEIKQKFFIEIKGNWVFNINDFVTYVSDKNFLSDSYTKFKNKIGLNIDGKFLNERKEVSLVWPFKDCVLEAGMTKEDQKRNEIFFNETLAHDEIDRLLDPKALTNFKKYTAKGEEIVKEFKRDENGTIKDNLIIKGNNLLVSRSILNQYQNKIKLVYLDPPYNTPGEANTFSYNNTFNHSTWLTFMKNRIEVSKELISEDGIICLAIDDAEYAYLKVLCDEILGRDNFIATVVVQIKREGRTDSEFFAASHDYAVFYCKNKKKVKLGTLPISEENSLKWKEEDETGRFFWRDFMRTGGNSTPKDRPNQLRPLADFAGQLFNRIRKKEFELVISDWVLFELKKYAEPNRIKEFINSLKSDGALITIISKTDEDIKKAKAVSRNHYEDALHAVLANKLKCDYLVTRNIEDYENCSDLIEVKFPENI